MKLSQMEYFLAVAEELNFTAAANALFISQPALSRQIAALEQELGVRLFERTSRKVVLTAAGRQLRDDLQDIMVQLERARQRAAEIGNRERLNLRIACFDGGMTDDFLPFVLRRIRQEIPGVNITLSRRSFGENQTAFRLGEIDLLLTLGPGEVDEDTCCVQRVGIRRGALIYSANSVLAQKTAPTIEDFSAQTFLICSKTEAPTLYTHSLEVLRGLGITRPQLLEADNYSVLSAYLDSGYGYALLAESVADKAPNLHRFDLGDRDLHYVVAVWKKQHPMAKLLSKCFESFDGQD